MPASAFAVGVARGSGVVDGAAAVGWLRGVGLTVATGGGDVGAAVGALGAGDEQAVRTATSVKKDARSRDGVVTRNFPSERP
jgi:hypothetical protein